MRKVLHLLTPSADKMNTGGPASNINLKYKTSKCRHFEQTGNCQLGERCHFAHGDHELRTAADVIALLVLTL